jgi:16S rRNA (adenine1518-N6/adenine1519-N6)-dimethyltransferase
MTLSEMRQVLAAGDIQLTKSLGQNFLHDGNQLRRIVAAAELAPGDSVLEIGPGLGPLTALLLAREAKVLAIEKDGRLVSFLRAKFGGAPNLTLIHADALAYLRQQPADWSDWKLVANLPYSVVSAILIELAKAPQCPARLVTTVQLEVARRLMAQAGHADYGLLSLLVQLRYTVRDWFKIPAACFFPQPEVDSACVTLVRRPQPLLEADAARTFTRLVKCAFSQRRKMMLKRLKEQWPGERLEAAMSALGLSPRVRAEEVSLEQFVALTRALGESGQVQAARFNP